MPKFCVIVAAAGKGERFGGQEKKTYAKLDGRPVFLRTIELFISRKDVVQTILAVAPEDVEMVKRSYGPNLGFMGVTVAAGGARRADTIAAALKSVSDDAEYVAVHDAVRPCVSDRAIDAVFAEAAKTGAAILAAPFTGTIKRVGESNVIEETVPRAGLFEAQTPQVFRKDILVEAYAGIASTDEEFTDDAQVVERAGHAVFIVVSDATNVKITTKGDMALANALVKSRPVKKAPKFGAFEEAQW